MHRGVGRRRMRGSCRMPEVTRPSDPRLPILRAALFGVLLGLGLGLAANVSGAVLAFYGLVVGTVAALVTFALKRRG